MQQIKLLTDFLNWTNFLDSIYFCNKWKTDGKNEEEEELINQQNRYSFGHDLIVM